MVNKSFLESIFLYSEVTINCTDVILWKVFMTCENHLAGGIFIRFKKNEIDLIRLILTHQSWIMIVYKVISFTHTYYYTEEKYLSIPLNILLLITWLEPESTFKVRLLAFIVKGLTAKGSV